MQGYIFNHYLVTYCYRVFHMPKMKFKKETQPLRVPMSLLHDVRNMGLDARHWATIGLEMGLEKKRRGLI